MVTQVKTPLPMEEITPVKKSLFHQDMATNHAIDETVGFTRLAKVLPLLSDPSSVAVESFPPAPLELLRRVNGRGPACLPKARAKKRVRLWVLCSLSHGLLSMFIQIGIASEAAKGHRRGLRRSVPLYSDSVLSER